MTEYPMNIIAYMVTVFTPSCLFMILSIPVKRRNILHEAILALLWFTELSIPIYYAGQFSYICLITTAVWAWATSMKMGVWVFSMSMEERRQRAFVFTLFDWRKKRQITPNTATTYEPRPDGYLDLPLGQLIVTTIQHQLVFDFIDFIFNYGNIQRPVVVFSALVSKLQSFFGTVNGTPTETLTLTNVMVSTLMCMLFCVHIQMQLQVTFDAIMVGYAAIYKILPSIERWQLGDNKLDSKNISKAKTMLRRVQKVRAVKFYIEETLAMPPLFDKPWTAHSLRDFWGKRWHTFYNDCFYRLGYRPIRWIVQLVFNCKPPRWLPALAVFIMSGIMHEFFLYAATGPALYFGSPLPACGLQFLFFVVQVGFISIGDALFSRGGVIGKLYAVCVMALTSHLFVVPYILTGYLTMGHFSFYRIAVNLYQGNYTDLYATVV